MYRVIPEVSRRGGSPASTAMIGRDAWRAIAVVALIAAIKVDNGYYIPAAALGIGVAVAALVAARQAPPGGMPRMAWALLIAAFAAGNASYIAGDPLQWWPGVALAGVGAVVAVMSPVQWLRCVGLAACVAGMALLIAAHWDWGQGFIDVYYIVQGAGQQLLQGHNPYSVIYPHTVGLSFTYGPAVVLLAAPAAWLGDARVASVACAAALVAAIAILARRHSVHSARAITASAIVVPVTPLLITAGWTELYPVTAIAWWLVLRGNHRPAALIVLALGIASKFTAWPLLAVLALWAPVLRGELIMASVLGAVLCVPFAIVTGVGNFVYDVAGEFFDTGSRASLTAAQSNSLTLTSMFHGHSGMATPVLVTAALGLLVLAWLLTHRPRDLADLMDAAALTSVVLFFLARWAYFNYYAIPVSILMVSFALGAQAVPGGAGLLGRAGLWPRWAAHPGKS